MHVLARPRNERLRALPDGDGKDDRRDALVRAVLARSFSFSFVRASFLPRVDRSTLTHVVRRSSAAPSRRLPQSVISLKLKA